MTILSNRTITAPKVPVYCFASGGTEPYTWEVLAGGAGGSVNSSGIYTPPDNVNVDPKKSYDTIRLTDSLGEVSTLNITVGSYIDLLCNIIQTEMGLSNGQVYFYEQKIDIPKDYKIYIAVGVLSSKPFGRSSKFNDGIETQSVNTLLSCSIDILSRSIEAFTRKEELILALGSQYSESMQEANNFHVAPLSQNFVNLSQGDGAAIPYRYNITCNMQYMIKKVKAVPYYDNFQDIEIVTDP